MNMVCCGKIIRTPFCPTCGKAVGSADSLLAYLEYELAKTILKKGHAENRVDPEYDFYRPENKIKNEVFLKTICAKIERIESWINLVSDIL